MILVRR